MGERRILVIGSQCEAARQPLSFLPSLAQDLYAVMTDTELGRCVPALDEGALLVDPSVGEARDAIETAFQRASKDEATLFLAFIGHGEYVGSDFYLLPCDAPIPPMSHKALDLVQLIKDLHGIHSGVDGLVVLLDACHSGMGATGAAARWVGELAGTLRFEVLTATDDRTAADGCFSRNIAAIMREGIPGAPSELRCEQVREILVDRCPNQLPQLPTYNADPGLYLTRNVAVRREAWVNADVVAAEVERLTVWFEPLPQLAEVVSANEDSLCVALVGLAGTGKSALAAALARPEVTDGMVPEAFVQAIAFITEGTTASLLAEQLAHQLRGSVPGFADAKAVFCRHTTQDELAELDALQREIIGPLRRLHGDRKVRVVVDGLDQLPPAAASLVQRGLDLLASDPLLGFVRLVVTSRAETSLPTGARKLTVGRADDEQIRAYLKRRQIAPGLGDTIVTRADGNWLISRLLADLATAGAVAEDLPQDLVKIYDHALHQAGAGNPERWRKELRPVLGTLAAAGTGPVLPFELLHAASAKLGGPSRVSGLRDVLVDLQGFVVRAEPGGRDEHVGLFHESLADYLLDPAVGEFGIEPEESHRALAEAIEALAPMAAHSYRNSLHRYATAREAEHLWAISEHAQALKSLKLRELPIPVENLNRWRRWHECVNAAFGLNHPEKTLTTRANIAFWTGQAGNAREALRLFEELLPDHTRVLGPDHPDTLNTRNNIAAWIGQTGAAREALRLSQALLPVQTRVLGPDHRYTLATRNNIAAWTGQTGDAREALRLFEELLPVQTRVLGPDHPNTLTTRGHTAVLTGQTGDAREALRLSEELLADQTRVLGPDHPNTLNTRNNITGWTGQTGDAREALRLSEELLPDRERVLGRDHPDTLTTRQNIAAWTGKAGDPRKALRLFEELLPDQTRVLGPDHHDTLKIRGHFAFLTGQTGAAREALRLSEELLPDQTRVLGPDHPDTLTTRSNIATSTGQTGDAREALRLFEALLPDQAHVLGPDHPDTLTTRNNIAFWTGQTGDASAALRLSEELLPDRERVLGPDHPDTLTTRNNIAALTGQAGDAREALRLSEALLPDQARVLGPDHPDTLTSRNNIAVWIGQTRDAREARRLFEALLPDRESVLGRDHPDTLNTRHNVAFWTGQAGDAREALRLFEALLPDRERVLGRDHPNTLTTRHNTAAWTRKARDAREALRLFEALLPDQTRVLGPDHPDTLKIRGHIAFLTGQTGDAREALRLSEALLPDQTRVLGPDHPDTLNTRHNIAFWTGQTGHACEALRLSEELLPDRERVLGPDHPDTLTTRNNIAFLTGQTGDSREALRLFEALLPDQARVLGPDHSDTLDTRSWIKHWQYQAPQ